MMQTKSFADPVVLFAAKPDLSALCTVSVRVESGALPGTTQPRILKCRELIFTEPDVIASPAYDQFESINIVMTQTLFKTGRIQTRMKNSNLNMSKPFRVTSVTFQSCLRYTVLARLAPAWNKAGDWLIQGRDFVTHAGCANAVECDVEVNAEELYISVRAAVLRLAPLQLSDLNLSALEMQSLLYNVEHGSGELTIHNVWCKVMPSMKRGRLVSISLAVPEESPFTTYKELKRHWKNTYGYRLPETDDDIFYGQISFWGTGGKQFTYPSVCLRSETFHCIPRVDPKPILTAFLQDLHSKVPSACGQPLRFQPQVRHAMTALYTASQEVRGPGPNLSKRSSNNNSTGAGGGRQIPLRDPRQLVSRSSSSQHIASATPSQVSTLKSSAMNRSFGNARECGSEESFTSVTSRATSSQALTSVSQLPILQQTPVRTHSAASNRNRSEIWPSTSQTSMSNFDAPYWSIDKLSTWSQMPRPDSNHSATPTPTISSVGEECTSMANRRDKDEDDVWARPRNQVGGDSSKNYPQQSASFQFSPTQFVQNQNRLESAVQKPSSAHGAPLCQNKEQGGVNQIERTPKRSLSLKKPQQQQKEQQQQQYEKQQQQYEKQQQQYEKQQQQYEKHISRSEAVSSSVNASGFGQVGGIYSSVYLLGSVNASEPVVKGSAPGGGPGSGFTVGGYASGSGSAFGECASGYETATQPARIVPVFRPKSAQSSGNNPRKSAAQETLSNSNINGGLAANSSKIVPAFRPKIKASGGPNSKQVMFSNKTAAARFPTHLKHAAISSPKVTSSTEPGEGEVCGSNPFLQPSFSVPKAPVFQAKKPQITPKFGRSVTSLATTSMTSLVVAGRARTPGAKTPIAKKLKNKMDAASEKMLSQNDGGTSSQPKRKHETHGGDGGEKKARSKPQVQDVDVEALARNDQLGKVNSVTLISWLKERGVHCKSKDKKGDLVDRVKVFLAITAPES